MKLSITTPSYNSARWLPLCVASVADQAGVAHEHLVQDACSTDGSVEWLQADGRAQFVAEKDRGMYDAVARGFARSQGEVLAYLNCDEQYLPGALAKVARHFAEHPEVEVAIGHWLVVDEHGGYLCHRYALEPRWAQLWYRFNVSTSALFIRRSVVERGHTFGAQWRYLGDFFWLEQAVRAGVRFGVVPEFLSVFTETGTNLSLQPGIVAEEQERLRRAPAWVKASKQLWLQMHRWRYLRSGAFQQRPFDYEIYTPASPTARQRFHVSSPTPRWPGRS